MASKISADNHKLIMHTASFLKNTKKLSMHSRPTELIRKATNVLPNTIGLLNQRPISGPLNQRPGPGLLGHYTHKPDYRAITKGS